jgi:NADH-quinone oxidoreductase subunit E
VAADELGPGLSEAVKAKTARFSRGIRPAGRAAAGAATLPGCIGLRLAAGDARVAELLELSPAAVMDVVSFYTHFWTHPRGRKTIVLCRSLTCELMGGKAVLEALQQKLGIREHETTPDGEWSLMTEECLAACEHAPCMQINERMHKCVRVEDLDRILADPENDKLPMPRSALYDAPREA